MISVGSNLLYETPDEEEEEQRDYSDLFKTNLCDLCRIKWSELEIAGGGIQHGSLIEIADCINNQHASITVYHQKLDDLVEKYEDGYVILNPEVILRFFVQEMKRRMRTLKQRRTLVVLTWKRIVIYARKFHNLSREIIP